MFEPKLHSDGPKTTDVDSSQSPNSRKHVDLSGCTEVGALEQSEGSFPCSSSSSSSASSSQSGKQHDDQKNITSPYAASNTSTTQTSSSPSSSTASPIGNNKKPALSAAQDRRNVFMTTVKTQLARQLAYYFSPSNLPGDTYLRTLQDLNDGCVPLRILANFGKIQGILSVTHVLRQQYHDESARVQVLEQACVEHSAILQVVPIDASSGKVVDGDDTVDNKHTLQAVRPVDRPMDGVLLDTTSASTEQNVREIMERLTADDAFVCPAVLKIRCDVANCWFVTLDTRDNQILLQVVERLRKLEFQGNPIQAHLPDATLPVSQPVDHVAIVTEAAMRLGLPLQRKKNRKRGKKKKGKNARSNTITAEDAPGQTINRPPSLEEFPTLHENTVEWAAPLVDTSERTKNDTHVRHAESHDDEEEEDLNARVGKAHSDAASTATTTSSSTESGQQGKKALAGYAAAVLKSGKPVNQDATPVSASAALSATGEDTPATSDPAKQENGPVIVEPPSWGRGRSFADAAKTATEEAATL